MAVTTRSAPLTRCVRTPRVYRAAAEEGVRSRRVRAAALFWRSSRLQDHHGGPARSQRRVAVEVSERTGQPAPQSRPLVLGSHSRRHVARPPSGEFDAGVRMGLEIEPPGGFRVGPAVHGYEDQLRAVLDIAEDAPSLLGCPASARVEAQEPSVVRVCRSQAKPSRAHGEHRPVNHPCRADEPAWRQPWGVRGSQGHGSRFADDRESAPATARIRSRSRSTAVNGMRRPRYPSFSSRLRRYWWIQVAAFLASAMAVTTRSAPLTTSPPAKM